MQSKFLLLLLLLCSSLHSQNDLCSNATILIPSTNCTATYANLNGATLDGNSSQCAPNTSQDIWFKFTATDPTMYVEVSNPVNVGLDLGIEIYEDSCGGNLITCQNFGNSNQGYEGYFNNNFNVGATYYIRVMNVLSTTANNYPFSICVQKYITPSNDLCADAIILTQAASCNDIYGSFAGSSITTAPPTCASSSSQDVWYKFVANNTTLTISESNAVNIGLDAGLEIYSADCTSTPIGCVNQNGATSGYEIYSGSNFIIGTTYYVRVFNTSPNLSTRLFSICVQGTVLNASNFDFKQITLSPNPTSSRLTLHNMPYANSEYLIYNTLGQEVKKGITDIEINVEDLKTGIYLLKLSKDQNENTFRFIKE